MCHFGFILKCIYIKQWKGKDCGPLQWNVSSHQCLVFKWTCIITLYVHMAKMLIKQFFMFMYITEALHGNDCFCPLILQRDYGFTILEFSAGIQIFWNQTVMIVPQSTWSLRTTTVAPWGICLAIKPITVCSLGSYSRPILTGILCFHLHCITCSNPSDRKGCVT